LRAALADFRGALLLSLGLLAALLMLAVWAQVSVGLRPLRALQQAVRRVRQGVDTRLQGAFPAEVQPLVEDFNRVLDHADEVVERARRLAGNLAHGIKTPLAVMSALADDETLPRAQLVRQWREQLQMVQDQVDRHLRRARAAALAGHGQRTPVAPALEALLRVMRKVHVCDDRAPLAWTLQVAPDLAFAGELQDWQEMAGNLLDNAGRWARQRVVVTALRQGAQLVLRVEDDGPGLSAAQCAEVLRRGIRLDERTPGSGLGLDIVCELARLYGGDIELTRSVLGGLCAELRVPAAPPPATDAAASR
jgi:signal transduction histidine kinase